MTIDPPDFDEGLTGHDAVEAGGLCHALVTDYAEDGSPRDYTECGLDLEARQDYSIHDTHPRSHYVAGGVEMCADCWPSEIVEVEE